MVILDNIKIAVIDNGVVDDLLMQPLGYKVCIDNTNRCVIDNEHMELSGFIHGTICAMIIEDNFPESTLYSLRILNEDGIGKVDKLKIALDWCYENNIFLVNLSLGMTYFHDKAVTRDIINHYANRGIVIVAASANSGYKTYPASFSNVIGVVAGKVVEVNTDLQKQIGIDFVALSDHEIEIEGNSFRLGISNSYAAPYVTAMVGNLLKKESNNDICSIRRKLLPEIEMTTFLYYPDWIETAWVSERCGQSEGRYYFKEVKGELDACISMIDTIVVKDREEVIKYYDKKKHIVYLGKDSIEHMVFDRYFWSSELRVAQIIDCKERILDIDIPIIICKFVENQDIILGLSELRDYFGKDGYNVYAMSSKIESVLYDLEFIPEELCSESAMEQVHNFLYWQTYYCQSDVILLGIDASVNSNLSVFETIADIVIKVNDTDGEVKTEVYCGGKIEIERIFECIDHRALNVLYQEILRLFTEDTDE